MVDKKFTNFEEWSQTGPGAVCCERAASDIQHKSRIETAFESGKIAQKNIGNEPQTNNILKPGDKIAVYKYVDVKRENNFRPVWEKKFLENGYFQKYGMDFDHVNETAGNFSVVIYMNDDGEFDSAPVDMIKVEKLK